MKKKILACDLDNTLIYSYKHRVAGDGCVEWLNGQEQSFMTAAAQALLPQAAKAVRLIPVTTRSLEQYQRLVWPRIDQPRLAVTTNGGLLLRNGKLEGEWCGQARKLAAAYLPALLELAGRLEKIDQPRFAVTVNGDLLLCGGKRGRERKLEGRQEKPGLTKCRLVDDIYLYAVCPDAAAAEQCAADFAGYADRAGLQVQRGGRKVYFLPPQIDKGWAVQGLRGLFPGAEIIAAGDSELDLPMLDRADIALLPDGKLAGQTTCRKKYVCPPDEHFAEFVLKMTLNLAEKE